MMSVSYRNTRRDILAFTAHHYVRGPWNWVFLVGFVLATLPATISRLSPKNGVFVNTLVTFVAEALLLLFLIGVPVLILLMSLSRRGGIGTLDEHLLIVDRDVLTEQTVVNTSIVKWAGVRKMLRTRNYLFVYVGPGMAHPIPRRAAASADEWERLCTVILDAYHGARLAGAPT